MSVIGLMSLWETLSPNCLSLLEWGDKKQKSPGAQGRQEELCQGQWPLELDTGPCPSTAGLSLDQSVSSPLPVINKEPQTEIRMVHAWQICVLSHTYFFSIANICQCIYVEAWHLACHLMDTYWTIESAVVPWQNKSKLWLPHKRVHKWRCRWLASCGLCPGKRASGKWCAG